MSSGLAPQVAAHGHPAGSIWRVRGSAANGLHGQSVGTRLGCPGKETSG